MKREEGNLAGAAAEYERVAAEADDPELRREALLEAGDLYEKAKATERALAAYLAYVEQFPEPIEPAVETRFKIAGMYAATHDAAALSRPAATDRRGRRATPAASAPTRVRYLAAQSALVLAQDLYRAFAEVALVAAVRAEPRRRSSGA